MDNSGPAFPQPSQAHPENPAPGTQGIGMSKREWYAALAITYVGMLTIEAAKSGVPVKDNDWSQADIAEAAFNIADAMLAKANKEPTDG